VRGVLTALVAETWLGVCGAEGDGLGRIWIFSGLPCAGSHGTERRELAAVQIWGTAFGGGEFSPLWLPRPGSALVAQMGAERENKDFSGLPCAGSHGTERRELAAVQILFVFLV